MQPKFPMLHPCRSRTKEHKNRRLSHFVDQNNGTDYSESNPTDSPALRFNDYGGSPEGRNESVLQQNASQYEEIGWLDRFCQSGMNNE